MSSHVTLVSPIGIGHTILIWVTLVLGWGSLALMLVFLFNGGLELVNLGMGETDALVLNACLSMAFFLQHSCMIRRSLQQRMARYMDERYQGVSYTLSSSVVLLVLVIFWQQSGYTVASAEGVFRWLLRGVFACSLIGFFWGTRAVSPLDLFGIRRLRRRLLDLPQKPDRFRVRGPYRWVRHPLYFFCLLMIWSCPDVSVDRFMFNCLWSAWIIMATVLEERDLVHAFGEDYRRYRKEVPMLIPRTIFPIRQDFEALPGERHA
ncbi:MAG TPA: isoprenylcysteine carboxylmethyltransferase family protein [Desulfomonilaceae bacterium]|nr:isoprenylcysteine carboxylmethyltransferase family protein [Desulfomonilaceae bacterium]